LTAVVDRMVAADPSSPADAETVLGLNRQLERLGAVNTRVTAAFDASRAWADDGARSAAAWLATRAQLPPATARRRVRVGRALRSMGIVEEAWLAGDIGDAQVGLLANAHTPATAEVFSRDEQALVDDAIRLRFGDFSRVLWYWSYHADPDGAESQATKDHASRRLHLSQSYRGMWFGDFALDAISGAIVNDELKRIADELFAADWAEARRRLGADPTALDLCRTPAQRRADALVEMATRSASSPGDGRRPEPLFSVFVGYESFAGMICELANGTVITPGSLVPHVDRAWVERVVFDGPSRVTDVGVHRRIFGGGTRRAVQARDRQCFHPYCDRPAEDCEIDHVEPYAAGGLTTQANGRVACDFHNRARHRRS